MGEAVSVTTEAENSLRRWTPPCVPDRLLAEDRLRYLVVDEIVDEVATLAVAPWPGSDEQGRVRFPAEPPSGHLLVHVEELYGRLYEHWLRRLPRVGDALATVLARAVDDRLATTGEVVLDGGLRLRQAVPGTVADLSAEARNIAKLAFYAAVAGVQEHATAVDMDQVPDSNTNGGASTTRPGRVLRADWAGPVVQRSTAAAPADPRRAVPTGRWPVPGSPGLVEAITDDPTALVYFLLNIGDGDAQLLLLPTDAQRARPRRAVVVDAGTTKKLAGLMADLADPRVGILPPADDGRTIALVVATHPHDDHIEGLAELVRGYGAAGIGDLWEPGYYAPTRSFAELMAEVEDARIPHCEPTAGMVRYIDGVKITVLAPSVQLRTSYDTLGVDCNDASIVLKLEFPAARISRGMVEELDGGRARKLLRRQDLKLSDPWSIILGADAQTTSWSHVTTEFVQLHRGHDGDLYRAQRRAAGRDHLSADVLKVSHHASKHGINIELIERMRPRYSLISSVGGGGRYGFPHALATDAIAEALSPSTRKGTDRPCDADLGIHYTGGLTADGDALGSIAVLVPAKVGGELRMWRFGDSSKDPVDLAAAQQLSPVRV